MAAVDPRLFPRRVRYAALLAVNVYVFMGNMYSVSVDVCNIEALHPNNLSHTQSGIATGFESLAIYFHADNDQLSALIVYSVLAMGLANLFWMPLALCFGKRPVVLVSMAMFLGGVIWSVVAQTYDSLLASRVFASFGYGAIESLGPSILADIFFERNYASAMAVYAAFLSGGSQIGPMIAGYLIEARGWRWFFILCAIIAAVNFVTAIFMLPETIYEPDEQPATAEENEEIEKGLDSHLETIPTRSQVGDRVKMDYGEYFKGLFTLNITKGAKEKGVFKFFAYLLVLPLPLLLVPGVLIASIMYGAVLGGIVVISTLSPSLFSPPPYLFTSSELGLFTLSSFIGIVIAWPIAGPLTDILSRWLRKRNGNVHKPEHRLPALIFPFLVCPVGLVVFGYTVARQEHYVKPAVGAAISAAGLTLVPSVMLSYVVDSYPRASGEALVLVNASKNVVAFGLAKGAYAWMAQEGVDKMFYELAGIQWACIFLALPLYIFGPWMRARTQKVL
ncbi:uncharacterized protein N7482_000554 [Penicillium canariense]|uniref:Major facilitator superfamily (MFS) profile domain-containing protein n=1 Tax=Penicillium canariense TaxID=189055 RepID=A0A9W9LT88_9EURO|nr:uncharacterized protein N7482_000554 [Penicillium canariense]KAJ5174677.1 hypothetical protein N7482_000554 [Penicillium canariense]